MYYVLMYTALPYTASCMWLCVISHTHTHMWICYIEIQRLLSRETSTVSKAWTGHLRYTYGSNDRVLDLGSFRGLRCATVDCPFSHICSIRVTISDAQKPLLRIRVCGNPAFENWTVDPFSSLFSSFYATQPRFFRILLPSFLKFYISCFQSIAAKHFLLWSPRFRWFVLTLKFASGIYSFIRVSSDWKEWYNYLYNYETTKTLHFATWHYTI